MTKKIALLTAGGFAPCLSTAIGSLIERYTQVAPEIEIIAYRHGYQGLLTGDYLVVDEQVRANATLLKEFGGSPIGNSRVKLTNAKDLVKRGLVKKGVVLRLILASVVVAHVFVGCVFACKMCWECWLKVWRSAKSSKIIPIWNGLIFMPYLHMPPANSITLS